MVLHKALFRLPGIQRQPYNSSQQLVLTEAPIPRNHTTPRQHPFQWCSPATPIKHNTNTTTTSQIPTLPEQTFSRYDPNIRLSALSNPKNTRQRTANKWYVHPCFVYPQTIFTAPSEIQQSIIFLTTMIVTRGSLLNPPNSLATVLPLLPYFLYP